MSDYHSQDKKHKKLAQLLKNRKIQRINLIEEEHARGRALEKEREEEIVTSQTAASRSAAAKDKSNPEAVWSAKLQQIRDKNTGRTRMATERWNRFAGTEGGGGRGL
jgi:hypothetical protein